MTNTVKADLDGDGVLEQVTGSGNRTQVIKNGVVIWDHVGAIDGYNRGKDDSFYAADVDGDGHAEIFVTDDVDKWTAVFKWDGTRLRTVWASASPVTGAAGGWNRGKDDHVLPADVDGDGLTEILLYDNIDKWTGLLKWVGGAMQTLWMRPSPLTGPGGQWNRSGGDAITVNKHNPQLLNVTNNKWCGIMQWSGSNLGPLYIATNPPAAPAVNILNDINGAVEISWSGPPAEVILSWTVDFINSTGDQAGGYPNLPPSTIDYEFQVDPSEQWKIDVVYFLLNDIQSSRASFTIDVTSPAQVTVPNVIGQVYADALTQLTSDHLLGDATNVTLVNTSLYKVATQDPSAGTVVDKGSTVYLTVEPLVTTSFASVMVNNQNTDGRSVDLYLVDLAEPNVATPEDSLAINSTKSLTLPQAGHTYEVIAVDTGLSGCDGGGWSTVSCQRTTSPPLLCATNGGVYPFTIS